MQERFFFWGSNIFTIKVPNNFEFYVVSESLKHEIGLNNVKQFMYFYQKIFYDCIVKIHWLILPKNIIFFRSNNYTITINIL
jgi:hypothetical protein